MSFEEVEYDCVADQRVIISDDEENDYFLAVESRAVPTPPSPRAWALLFRRRRRRGRPGAARRRRCRALLLRI